MRTIAIIGTGNLGSSIARGFISSKQVIPEHLWVTNLDVNKNLSELKDTLNVQTSTDNATSIKHCDVVIFCLLPHTLLAILEEHKTILKNKIIGYTAAGISIAEVEQIIGNEKIFRLMPNTAAAISESITCISAVNTDQSENDYMLELFKSIGDSIMVEESMINAATILGASGIAFFLRYIRASIQSGIQMGFHPHQAQQIISQACIGAAKLLKDTGLHSEVLIDQVTTPKGVTIEGLNNMEQEGLTKAITKGLMAAYKKLS